MDGIYPDGGSDNSAGEEGTIACPVGSPTWCEGKILPGYPPKYKTEELEGPMARRRGGFRKPVLAEVHEAISVRYFFTPGPVPFKSKTT
jgi:hypothetical protein